MKELILEMIIGSSFGYLRMCSILAKRLCCLISVVRNGSISLKCFLVAMVMSSKTSPA